jgi:anti-repressor protein
MQIATINTQPTMSSRDVADLLESRHDDVKRSIERLALKELIQQPPVAEVKNSQGQTVSVYLLNKRDSYVVVAQLSPTFTAKLVDRWQELEAKQLTTLPNFLDPAEAAMAWATEYKAKQAAQLQIAHMKPFADFGEAVSASATDVLIGDWIKAINDGGLRIGRNKAFQWFRSQGYLGDRNMPMQKYIDQGLFKVKEGLINLPTGQRATFTTMLTGKGQVYFANKLTKEAK